VTREASDPPCGREPADRRTLDEVFGDVLPDVTRDEMDDRPDRAAGDTDLERWYRENRPPHHG
jgi:hypothetical protein